MCFPKGQFSASVSVQTFHLCGFSTREKPKRGVCDDDHSAGEDPSSHVKQYSAWVGSTVTSQQEGPGFKSGSEAFLCGV